MLKKLSIERFKSMEAELEFSNLNFFVGTNASEKSNFFDSLRALEGIGCGFTIQEIFHGYYLAVVSLPRCHRNSILQDESFVRPLRGRVHRTI